MTRTLGARRTRNVIAKVATPSAAIGGELSADATERALGELGDRVNALVDESASVYVADVDLAVGSNTISHGLGRRPTLVYLVPAEADASFAWGWDPVQTGNASPTRTTTITIAGVPMRARIEIR